MLLSIDISKFADIKTVISLVALLFTATVSYLAYRRRLQIRESKTLIESAPSNRRAELIEQMIGKWGLSAKGMDADRQFELIKQLERQKERRFYFSAISSAFLLILAGLLIWKDINRPELATQKKLVALMDSTAPDVVYSIKDSELFPPLLVFFTNNLAQENGAPSGECSPDHSSNQSSQSATGIQRQEVCVSAECPFSGTRRHQGTVVENNECRTPS